MIGQLFKTGDEGCDFGHQFFIRVFSVPSTLGGLYIRVTAGSMIASDAVTLRCYFCAEVLLSSSSFLCVRVFLVIDVRLLGKVWPV